jgi:hypothetical protein
MHGHPPQPVMPHHRMGVQRMSTTRAPRHRAEPVKITTRPIPTQAPYMHTGFECGVL